MYHLCWGPPKAFSKCFLLSQVLTRNRTCLDKVLIVDVSSYLVNTVASVGFYKNAVQVHSKSL